MGLSEIEEPVFPSSWAHGEADILKITATCLRTRPRFYKCNCISQEWPDKQTRCQETIYKCSSLCINATCTLGQNHHLLRPQPLKRETRQDAYSVLGPSHALNPGCLTDTSGLPAECLCGHVESCPVQLADLTMLSPACLEGCSPVMQEAMVKGLACGQEASRVLRPPLAESKEILKKSSSKLKGCQLWRHWVRTQASWSFQYGRL